MDEIKRRRRRVLTILRPREREGREGGELFCACAVETSHALPSPTLRHFVSCFVLAFSYSSSSSSSFFSLSLSLSMDETGQQQPNFDDDPAAGFLAREQDELQGIMSDDAPLVRRESTERGTYDFHFLLEYWCGSSYWWRPSKWQWRPLWNSSEDLLIFKLFDHAHFPLVRRAAAYVQWPVLLYISNGRDPRMHQVRKRGGREIHVPYSWNFLWMKTFANFVVWPSNLKVLFTKSFFLVYSQNLLSAKIFSYTVHVLPLCVERSST